jgi:hypothetical protein
LETPGDTKAPEKDLWSLGLLPVLIAGSIFALLGVYWDIAWHIDIGRDTFFTLPHNFLYASILIVLLASVYGLWRDRRDTRYHVRLRGLRLHPGVLMIAVAAALELAFAPLDDLWHRFFGVDVALWAPMHLVALLAMGVANFGGLVCAWVERDLATEPGRRLLFTRIVVAYGGLLLAWSMMLLAEYEYSIIQFPVILHPILLAALPSFALVLLSRLNVAQFAVTWSVLLFTGLRVLLAGVLMLTASLELAGLSRPMIPVLLLSAVAVDLLSRRRLAGWALGMIAAALGWMVNTVMVYLGDGLVWHIDTLALAVVPALTLAGLLGGAAGWIAGALTGEPLGVEIRPGAWWQRAHDFADDAGALPGSSDVASTCQRSRGRGLVGRRSASSPGDRERGAQGRHRARAGGGESCS